MLPDSVDWVSPAKYTTARVFLTMALPHIANLPQQLGGSESAILQRTCCISRIRGARTIIPAVSPCGISLDDPGGANDIQPDDKAGPATIVHVNSIIDVCSHVGLPGEHVLAGPRPDIVTTQRDQYSQRAKGAS